VNIDYRADPNSGATPTSPPTDQTWEGYDEIEDAVRFRGINSPLEQARLHAEPDPAQGSKGWSPG
jgi:hypothetical protein